MFFTPIWNWLKQQSLTAKQRRRLVRNKRRQPRLFLEALEDRTLMSVSPLDTTTLPPDSNHIGTDLLTLYEQSSGQGTPAGTNDLFVFDSQGRVAVNITADNVNQVLPGLQGLGFQLTASDPSDHLIEGYLPVSSILQTTELVPDGLLGVLPSYKPMTSAGLVDSESANVLESDRVNASTPGYDGTGVKVGILSDSYNALGGRRRRHRQRRPARRRGDGLAR